MFILSLKCGPSLLSGAGRANSVERLGSCVAASGKLLTGMEFSRDRIGQRTYHEHTGENICPSMVRGIDYLRDPRLNKVGLQNTILLFIAGVLLNRLITKCYSDNLFFF